MEASAAATEPNVNRSVAPTPNSRLVFILVVKMSVKPWGNPSSRVQTSFVGNPFAVLEVSAQNPQV